MLIAKSNEHLQEWNFAENKNTKCPIDAHCHRHCRGDPRIKGLHWCQNPAEALLGFSVAHELDDDLGLPSGATCAKWKITRTQTWARGSCWEQQEARREPEKISSKMGSCGAPSPRRLSAGLLDFGTHPFLEVLWNPRISSAMAMAMSIYGTLCVLVFFIFW